MSIAHVVSGGKRAQARRADGSKGYRQGCNSCRLHLGVVSLDLPRLGHRLVLRSPKDATEDCQLQASWQGGQTRGACKDKGEV